MLPYINLFPNYGTARQYETPDYETYLDEYVRICQPDYLSYDHYALNENLVLSGDGFYGNLETVRATALQHGIPFWNIVIGCHFSDGMAYPGPAMYNIQIYSTLAYGGRGVGYYTYYEYSWDWCNGSVCDTRAPVVNGRRTESWDYMRDINMQIHALAPVYCTLKSVNVFHTGRIPVSARGIASSVYVRSAGDGDFLVGEFADPDGTPYLLVVNRNLKQSVPVNLSLKEGGKLMRVAPDGQGLKPFEGIQAQLAPGAGALLKIED
ncbi:MAG: hypothetical protein LBQ01_07225, partial [Prevotellaceae bacterium]|jgi:hypothetical protein|nr:hypothetical protein [Prevotellaceae bacterium]